MKKIFTLLFLVLATTPLLAQTDNTFQFVDESGNVVEDGTVLIRGILTEDPFGEKYISTGLFVKNTSAGSAKMRVAYQIESMDNGMFQICFPINCVRKSETGSFTTEQGSMDAGAQSDLQCEWYPEAYGSCSAKLTIEVLNALTGSKIADGPSIMVTFNYADPAGISATEHTSAAPQQYFSLDGRKMDGSRKGLNIIRKTDGTTIKQIIK